MIKNKKKYWSLGVISLLLPLSSLLLSGCNKELMDYEGPESIYFCMQKDNKTSEYIHKISASINLMSYKGDEVEYALNVKTTGDAKDYDRPFRVVAADSSTAVAGVDYIMPEGGVIKAGEWTDSIHIRLLKNAKLENEEVKLCVQVVPNEYFNTDLVKFSHDGRAANLFDPRVFTISFTSMMEKPYWWESYKETGVENGNLGYFTAKKITLINELYSLTYADWLKGSGTINTTMIQVIYKRFGKYLIEQYKNHTPVLEADGRLMWVTGCPWQSFIGIPWDGTYMDI